MRHLDLFSGIGGFSIAVDTVYPNAEHIFCDNDKFCQAVLKKHWPKSKIYGDIRQLSADTTSWESGEPSKQEGRKNFSGNYCDLITGGFPCQPFSQAGKRRGTEDNRYLWPEMFRVIQSFKPTFVIAENVRGLVTWSEGMVLEQVCTDLESEGYEVQPIIIPAVAVNAPHRRDRIWIIACHPDRIGRFRREEKINPAEGREQTLDHIEGRYTNVTDLPIEGRTGSGSENERRHRQFGRNGSDQRRDWDKSWIEIATFFCQLDDELSDWLDRCFNDVIYLEDYENIYKNKGQSLSYLQKEVQSPEIWEKIRRFVPIFEQKDLLAILRKLEKESATQNNIPPTGKKTKGESLCCLWEGTWASVSSQRREHQKQLARELADALPQLPYETALEITEIWNHLSLAYSSMINRPAELGDFTCTKSQHRTNQLKAYGNAIVPQVAIQIIKRLLN